MDKAIKINDAKIVHDTIVNTMSKDYSISFRSIIGESTENIKLLTLESVYNFKMLVHVMICLICSHILVNLIQI